MDEIKRKTEQYQTRISQKTQSLNRAEQFQTFLKFNV